MIDIKELSKQLFEASGISNAISVEQRPPQFNLPLYLTKLYELKTAYIVGEKVLLAGLSNQDIPHVAEITRHNDILREKCKLQTVFVFKRIDSRTRQSLYKRHIAFIESEKNIYLPFFLLKTEISKVPISKKFATTTTTLDNWSQIILINQLCWQNIEGKTGSEITENLGIPRMTVSRAVNRLSELNLCKLNKIQKNKYVNFEETTSLWFDAKNFLTSPIKMISYIHDLPKNFKSIISGISALSEQTMLADDHIKTIAFSKKQFEAFKKADLLATQMDEATYKIEVWERVPGFTSRNGMVDSVSLYLCLRTDPDERVQIALEEMLKKQRLSFLLEENKL